MAKLNLTKNTSQLVRLALLTAFGTILFIFESYFPRPFPWLKPGLANIASLLALYWFGFIEALIITIVRILIGNIFSGTFGGPTFLLSFGGGIAAILVMGSVKQYAGSLFSIVGISVLGAVFHTLAQLLLASWIIVENSALIYFLPLMLAGAVIMGTLVGFLALQIDKRLMKTIVFLTNSG